MPRIVEGQRRFSYLNIMVAPKCNLSSRHPHFSSKHPNLSSIYLKVSTHSQCPGSSPLRRSHRYYIICLYCIAVCIIGVCVLVRWLEGEKVEPRAASQWSQ